MHDDELPLALGQPPSAAKMTTLHEDLTYRIQEALQSKDYSFRSAESDERRSYALMKEKNGRFSIFTEFSEKEIEGRSSREIADMVVQFMDLRQTVKADCTKVCAVIVILGVVFLESEILLGWLLTYTPVPLFLYRLFLVIGMVAAVYIGFSRLYARARHLEE